MIALHDEISYKPQGSTIGLSMEKRLGYSKNWNDFSGILSALPSSLSVRQETEDEKLLKQKMQKLAGLDRKSDKIRDVDEDGEPSSRAPAPSRVQTKLGNIKPDPLLAITPEKGNALISCAGNEDHTQDNTEEESGRKESKCLLEAAKRKPRVRFAPGTRTSPPSKDSSSQDHLSSDSICKHDLDDRIDSKSEFVQDKPYHPAQYADSNKENDIVNKSLSAQTCQRYSAQVRGDDGAYALSGQADFKIDGMEDAVDAKKSVHAKVFRHTCSTVHSSKEDEQTAFDLEVKEFLEGTSKVKGQYQGKECVRGNSASPIEILESCISDRSLSPQTLTYSRTPRSQSKSPDRCTPAVQGGSEFIVSRGHDRPQKNISVVREAPYRPPVRDYMYPFDSSNGKKEYQYDSTLENPLAKPEFNSALKISENLKSVKNKQINTWGEVSKRLKKKKHEIQEKVRNLFSSKQTFEMYHLK